MKGVSEILSTGFARKLLRQNLLILCYHGFSSDDEHDFKPSMFMKIETFRQRMRLLKEGDWPVLPLAVALDKLEEGTLSPGTVAITIDDGWQRTVDAAEQVLAEFDFSATVYVTTHYVEKQLPVSNIMLSYVLWKGRDRIRDLDFSGIQSSLGLSDFGNPESSLNERLGAKAATLDARERDQLNQEVAGLLGLDYKALQSRRMFHLMDPVELRRAVAAGCSLGLHGHRHLGALTADNEALLRKEIQSNKRSLETTANGYIEHYCYPSGIYQPQQAAWLRGEGIRSATTCEAGLNYRDQNRYSLRRFLDREDIDERRFLSELSGLRQFPRRMLGRS